MIVPPGFADRRVVVSGLSRAGLATARALSAAGAEVEAWDEDPDRRAAAQAQGIAPQDPTRRDWSDLAALIVSDVSDLHRESASRLVALARAVDATILTPLDLFVRAVEACGVRIAAFIGRGREEIAALTAFMGKEAGRDVRLAGARRPMLALAPPRSGAIYLLALATRELAAASLRADLLCAAEINEAEDAALRERSAFHAERLVLGADCARARRFYTRMRAQGRRADAVSARQALCEGAYVTAGALWDRLDDRPRRIAALKGLQPPESVAAAYAAARRLGASAEDCAGALARFPGAPDRMEIIARFGGLELVNHACASTPEAVVEALRRRPGLALIAGPGAPADLAGALGAASATPAGVVLIGDRGRARRKLSRHGPVQIARDLDEALARAIYLAAKTDAPGVLYAPGAGEPGGEATARRGDAFRAAVDALVAGLGAEKWRAA